MTVTVLTPRIVRVELTQSGDEAAPSYAAHREWASAPFDVVDGDPLRIVTTDLRVEIAATPLRIAMLDSHDDWLLREPADAGMSAQPAHDASGRRRLRASFVFSGEQHFYGLGERAPPSTGSASPGSSGTRTSVTARARTWACRSSCRAAATRSSSTIPATPSSRWDDRTPGCVVYTAEAGRLAWYFLLGATCAA